jgi:glycosyltransferase involved in cell wall biosynthesis
VSRAGEVPPVLHVVPRYPPPMVGGLERQAQELAQAQARAGVRVTVLSLAAPGQPADGAFAGVRVVRLPRLPAPLLAPALVARMAALRGEYRVVHLHNMSWLAVPVIATARVLGRAVITKLPNVGHVGGIPLQRARRFGGAWLAVFRRSDAMIALAEESLGELRDVGYPLERVLRVNNGVSTARFHPPAPGERPGNPVRFVFTGRLSPEKGLDDLLSVWPRVVERAGCAVRLELYGEGPLAEPLRARAAGLAGVELPGHAADVPALLRRADVFVLPSHAEGNSNSILEAMASALPVIGTTRGGTPAMLGEAGARGLVDPGDPAALEERMVALARDPALRRSLGQALLERVRAHYDIDVVAGVYARAYRLLDQGRADALGAIPAPQWA